jgi:GAF domain-containing protein
MLSPREQPSGVLVMGINPRRALDSEYRTFLDLVTRQMANALNTARQYEEERQRAEQLAEIDRAKARAARARRRAADRPTDRVGARGPARRRSSPTSRTSSARR